MLMLSSGLLTVPCVWSHVRTLIYVSYMLEEPILCLLGGVMNGFSVITSPNPNISGWNLDYIERPWCALAQEKNGGNCPRGSA